MSSRCAGASRSGRDTLTSHEVNLILLGVAIVVDGTCEWDDEKAAENVRKHGVAFEEAATVLADPNAVFVDDGSGTGRIVAIGFSVKARMLVVVHLERGSRDRVISARPATPAERDLYSNR